jgi:hypothetical protein
MQEITDELRRKGMMTRSHILILLSVLLISMTFKAKAQDFGNEWIDYDLQYYKIKTAQNEIHRLSYENLLNAIRQQNPGGDLASFDPDNFRLFHRGQEVALRFIGLEDNTFDPGDEIEFYGRRNDGTQDVELFYNAQDQIHQYYNLFSDTTAFFLTLENGSYQGNPLRMQTLALEGDGLPEITVHREEILNVYTNQFSFGQYYPIGNRFGETKRSLYDKGQMFMSRQIMRNEFGLSRDLNFADFIINDIVLEDQSFGKPELTVQVIGFNNVLHNATIFNGPNANELRVFRDEIQLNYNDFGAFRQQIEWSDVQSGSTYVRVEEIGFNEIVDSRIAVGYTKLTFPQFTDVQQENNQSAGAPISKVFNLYGSPNNGNLRIINSAPDLLVELYDITDYRNPVFIPYSRNGSTLTAPVENDPDGRKIYYGKRQDFIEVQAAPVTFQFPDLSQPNYYIISHPFLKQSIEGSEDPVQDYVVYRESVFGGGYDVAYANAPDLYDEFGYGEFTPLAIRRFMRKAYNEGNPEYLFLIGKSSRVDLRSQRNPNQLASSRNRELVPTLGAPGSDFVYTTDSQVFPTSRLFQWEDYQ